ncbi:hypothetical protein LEP3755_13690 [Leptolyngbya sp. NIES-3755]|nr:hypothetical protein LEP3755_13690 [Leptolyngbya sp. NIES-3755]
MLLLTGKANRLLSYGLQLASSCTDINKRANLSAKLAPDQPVVVSHWRKPVCAFPNLQGVHRWANSHGVKH